MFVSLERGKFVGDVLQRDIGLKHAEEFSVLILQRYGIGGQILVQTMLEIVLVVIRIYPDCGIPALGEAIPVLLEIVVVLGSALI